MRAAIASHVPGSSQVGLRRHALPLLAVILSIHAGLAACGDGDPVRAADVGGRVDAAAPDGGPPPVDAGPVDASDAPDAGSADAWEPIQVEDASAPDAAPPPRLDGVQLALEPVSTNALQAVFVLTAPVPVQFSAHLHGPGVDRRLESDAFEVEHRRLILELRMNTVYEVDVEATAADGRVANVTADFTTGVWSTDLPSRIRVVVDEPSADRGVTLFGVQGRNPTYVGVDPEGFVVWYYEAPVMTTFGDPGVIVRPLPDGNLFLMGGDEYRVINPAGQTLRRVQRPSLVERRFHHDGILLPDGAVLGLSREVRRAYVPTMGTEVDIVGDTVVEIDPAGDVVSRWSAFDHLDPTRFPGPLSREQWGPGLDWTHSNAVYYRGSDDTYLVSVRNQSWVVNVDRSTGDVLWIFGEDGDFELTEGEWFSAQHASEWVGDELVLYDNGNEKSPPASRAVAYELDVVNRTARQVWEWRVPFYTSVVGDVDRLSQSWLVTAGGILDPQQPATLFEVSDSGQILWQMELYGEFIYRAARVRSLSSP